MRKMSVAEARKKFANIINRVAFGNESIVLTRRGEEVAALVSIDELKLLQKIEDRMDIEDALNALEDPGENIPAAELWKKLGL